MTSSNRREAWLLDQLAKSELFHQKLHEWEMLEVADHIEQIRGESLDWNLEELEISLQAWNKAIHRGVKPVLIFTHPQVLISVLHSVSYYRMLAMVSQKSMNQVRLSTVRYEQQDVFPNEDISWEIAKHLNKIISFLVEADEEIDVREFDLWRGMAAGSQAQGSWQNAKGKKIEILIRSLLKRRLRNQNLLLQAESNETSIKLTDGRTIIFADEPDIGIYKHGNIITAIEVKGGIDAAGVLERVGAAIKSLSRAKEENPESVTILLLQSVSVSEQASQDLQSHSRSVNYWFTIEDVLENEDLQERFFKLLAI